MRLLLFISSYACTGKWKFLCTDFRKDVAFGTENVSGVCSQIAMLSMDLGQAKSVSYSQLCPHAEYAGQKSTTARNASSCSCTFAVYNICWPLPNLKQR